MIRVIVCGAYGKMGREVLKAVHNDPELALVGAVDVNADATDLGHFIGCEPLGLTAGTDLATVISATKPDVMVDFTRPEVVMENIRTALSLQVAPVVGTTGLGEAELSEIRTLCANQKVGALIAPNFSIGAILLMRLSQEAAKYLPHVEIIEMHHDQKLDAPSGTALHTAEKIRAVRPSMRQGAAGEFEKLTGARGGELDGIRIHSVRLPGYVAHQEVIFGGLGQTLSLRHDSISRESFMPGVVLACKKIVNVQCLIHGLDEFLQ